MKAPNLTFRSKLYSALLMAFFLTQILNAQTITWLGGAEAGNSDWTIGANWDGGVVPSLSNDVVITPAANPPVIKNGAAAMAKSVTLNANASLEIESNGILTIDGSVSQGITNQGIVENNGIINIDDTGGFALYNFGSGIFINKATLNVGQYAGNVIGAGIYNTADFENTGSAMIKIDNVGSDGIYNASNGIFTNNATINIGKIVGNISRYGIWNAANFNNNGGNLTVDNITVDGIRNTSSGNFTNDGIISVGKNGGNITRYGIWNQNMFENTNSGIVEVSNTGIYGIYNFAVFENTNGAAIHIDFTGDFSLYNFSGGNFTNGANLNIGLNGGGITGPGIYNQFNFDNNNGGNIKIDNTSSHGIYNISGNFTNEGTIEIGKSTGNIAEQGILNSSSFENKNSGNIDIANTGRSGIVNSSNLINSSGAVINIDNTGEDGILNNNGLITNSAIVNIGQNGDEDNIERLGIWNRSQFSNGGIINIDNTKFDAMYNVDNGNFINTGALNIGQNDGNIKSAGILNYSIFSNNSGGNISIDNVNLDAIYNVFGSTFTNTDAINIGQNGGNVKDYGIWNQAALFNNVNGVINIANVGLSGIRNLDLATFANSATINIANTGSSAIFNDEGTFDNSFIINIGQNAGINNVSLYGLYNAANFNNTGAGAITIDKTGGFPLYNFPPGIFTNEAQLNIGQNGGNSNGAGIYNDSNFDNINDGNIKIDNTPSHGINNVSGVFTNEAIIQIGKFGGNISGHGISNSGTFENKNSGSIHIANTGISGIINTSDFSNTTNANLNIDHTAQDGIFNNNGLITNSAIINIGQNGGEDNIGSLGIWNRATFNNSDNGIINIDNTKFDAMYNVGNGNFINSAALNIGQNEGNVKGAGILNYSLFSNNTGGYIKIDMVRLDAIYNVSGSTFTNNAIIDIGQNGGNVADYGIWNDEAQFNNNNGILNIANTGLSGIRNRFGSTFANMAAINISNTGSWGIWNEFNFNNNACATINLLSKLINSSTGNFTNAGIIIINTANAHDNTGTFTNGGILNYVQNNQIPFINNLEIVIAPTVADGCASISPALGLGDPVDFDILGIFTDANGNNSAGMFDETTNTFTPNPVFAEGVHNLFVKIDGGGCINIFPWKLTTQNCCPSLLITGNTQQPTCPGGNDGSLNINASAGQAPYTYTWSNGGVTAHLTNLTAGTYNVTVTDANGCTGTSQLTVPQGIDNIKPVITCPSNIVECGNQNITWPAPATSDNCGINLNSISCIPNSGTMFGAGTTVVNCSVTDVNGNSQSCTFSVTIKSKPNVNITSSSIPFGCQGLGVIKANVLNANALAPPISYSWSNGSAGTSIIVSANGNYTVTVTDGGGCSETANITTNFNLYNTLSNYTLIGVKEVELKTSTVNGGVGVKGAGKKAKVKDNSAVNGFVKAPDIDLNSSTINGGNSYPYPNNPPYGATGATLPTFKFNTATKNSSPNLMVNQGQTMTISSPNHTFNKIEIKEDGTLIVSGNISVLSAKEIKTEEGASIIFNGNTEVKVDKMDIEEDNTIIPSGTYTVTFWIESDLKLDEGSTFTGSVYALGKIESKAKANNQNLMTGTFISEDKVKSEYTTWNANPNCGFNFGGGQNLLALENDQLGLSALQDENQVDLMWVTNTEYKNSYFVVERSANGTDFQPLYEVGHKYGGNKPKQYLDVDQQPNLGPNYYRIKAVFEDGGFMYSEIKRVDFLMDLNVFNLWPNPAQESISILLDKFAGKPAKVSIFNSLGQPVLNQDFEALPNGPVSFELENIKDGMHHFVIQVEGYRMRTRSFVVAKVD